jgi:signal peptide peptidase SppA
MKEHRYQPRNPLQAIDPKAFLGLFMELEDPENDTRDDATIVTVRGPLSQYSDWWEDSYEAIRERVEEACQQSASVIALRIDSPGGDVAGLFDTARAIRAACDDADKKLVVHVEGQCCSAAYALACVADRFVASRTAEVGSIGVIAARVDESRALENMGVKISMIYSGDRKADGCPYTQMSDDERAEFQADIDSLAQEFFNFVSSRRGISAEEIAALEAATYRGDAALAAKLVDELGSFDEMIASLGAETGVTMSKAEEARDALRAMEEDEESSEEERENARRALAALDGEDEKKDEDAESAESESDEEEENDSAEDDDDEKAKAVSAKTAGELAARGSDLERRLEKLERQNEAAERKRLLAAHGSVSPGMAKLLASKPIAEVKAVLAEIPKPRKPKLGDHAATTTVPATRGTDPENQSLLPPEEAKALRRAMGLGKEKYGVVKKGNVQILGAPLDEGGES